MPPKQRAALAAIDELRSGLIVGLGTGSTAEYFLSGLGEAIRSGRLSGIRGVPTSIASERRANELGIPIIGFDVAARIDIDVDGADEIDPNLDLIKGLGGALLREKVVAQLADRFIVIADESKRVKKLGTQSPLPVEITQFASDATMRFLASLGCDPMLRARSGQPFITDNGNFIVDCRFQNGIDDPASLLAALRARAGVVDCGLFLGMADLVLIGSDTGVTRLT